MKGNTDDFNNSSD